MTAALVGVGTVGEAVAASRADYRIRIEASAAIGPDDVARLDNEERSRESAERAPSRQPGWLPS